MGSERGLSAAVSWPWECRRSKRAHGQDSGRLNLAWGKFPFEMPPSHEQQSCRLSQAVRELMPRDTPTE